MLKPNDTYYVLARKWRPQQFDEVVGQEHITRTLKNAISTGRIHHALLFIGSRGIGKTTTARIVAKALNCLRSDKPTPEPCDKCDNCIEISRGTHLDVQEIDGASNNSVDNIREIREAVRLAPAHARYKVYIIDEVHQLSTSAFNALLKTLEEPPPHAVFILATTEAHKIPATIISRCQRYDFRRVSVPDIVRLLEQIVKAEKRSATREALYAIARSADGGVRDAESILDQLMTYCEGEITYKDVQDVLGLIETEKIDQLVYALQDKDIGRVLSVIDEISTSGKDLVQFINEFIQHMRNLLVMKTTQQENIFFLPKEDIQRLKEQSQKFTTLQLIRLVEQLAELNQNFTTQLSHRTALEAFFIKNCKVSAELSIESIIEKLIQLEEAIQLTKTSSVRENSSLYPQKEEVTEKKTIESVPPEKEQQKFKGKNPSHITSGVQSSAQKTQTPDVKQTSSDPHYESSEDLTQKLLWHLAPMDAMTALTLRNIQASYHKEKHTLVISVPPAEKDALLALRDEKRKETILQCIREKMRLPCSHIEIIEREIPQRDILAKSPSKRDNNDLISPELAEELRRNPHIKTLLEKFKGRVVKVIALQPQEKESISEGKGCEVAEEISEDGVDSDGE